MSYASFGPPGVPPPGTLYSSTSSTYGGSSAPQPSSSYNNGGSSYAGSSYKTSGYDGSSSSSRYGSDRGVDRSYDDRSRRDRKEYESRNSTSYRERSPGYDRYNSSDRYGSSSYRPGGNSSYSSDRMSALGSGLTRQEWDLAKLPKFEKNFYTEHPNVISRSQAQVEEYRRRHDMKVFGRDIPKPVETFEEANFPAYVLKEILDLGFTAPTPIQSQGWPMALSGRDVVGIAETGSGKTLAYCLPSIVHINAQPYLKPGDGPIVQAL